MNRSQVAGAFPAVADTSDLASIGESGRSDSTDKSNTEILLPGH
jgi:hypothetical protein